MAKIIKLPSFKDGRGILTVLDKELPFKVKRVYFIYNAKGIRGCHSHKKNAQALLCINGKCKIVVSKKNSKTVFNLVKKNQCLFLKPNDWHQMMNFSKNCILLVLCSEKYNKSDYVN